MQNLHTCKSDVRISGMISVPKFDFKVICNWTMGYLFLIFNVIQTASRQIDQTGITIHN